MPNPAARKYAHPPIIEAVAEFRFDPATPWDLTLPGLMYEQLRAQFPKRKQVRTIQSTAALVPEGVQQQLIQEDRVQLFREDETASIQVSPNLLLVSHRSPYSTWERVLPEIAHALDVYRRVAAPKAFSRIGLRYINHIQFETPRVDLEDYFEFFPHVGPALPQLYGPFLLGIHIPFQNERDFLRLQLATGPAEGQALSVMLDLDYFLAKPAEVALEAGVDWLEQAHSMIETTFEGCLKERARRLFG